MTRLHLVLLILFGCASGYFGYQAYRNHQLQRQRRDMARQAELLRLKEEAEKIRQVQQEELRELPEAQPIPSPTPKPVPPGPNRIQVRQGDTLWDIAVRERGKGSAWYRIWKANQKEIPDFDRIYPDQVILIPVPEKPHAGSD
ncbi:MAG: LysM peptidoglycan-binding domain-containing protein [Elusimicrobia bacterium]|nr:LysM peptidoglycan-binding domain-containing protein [Elusimicrobiota bacterium]